LFFLRHIYPSRQIEKQQQANKVVRVFGGGVEAKSNTDDRSMAKDTKGLVRQV